VAARSENVARAGAVNRSTRIRDLNRSDSVRSDFPRSGRGHHDWSHVHNWGARNGWHHGSEWSSGHDWNWHHHHRFFFEGAWVIGDYPYFGDYPVEYSIDTQPIYPVSSTGVSVQQALADAGYYNGPIDGVVGPGTGAAIAAYQEDNGLPISGRIDDELMSSLGLI